MSSTHQTVGAVSVLRRCWTHNLRMVSWFIGGLICEALFRSALQLYVKYLLSTYSSTPYALWYFHFVCIYSLCSVVHPLCMYQLPMLCSTSTLYVSTPYALWYIHSVCIYSLCSVVHSLCMYLLPMLCGTSTLYVSTPYAL